MATKTIKGIKAGTTSIIASYTDGGVTKTASVNFTVSQATGYLTATTANKSYNGDYQTIATIATNSGDYYFGLGSSTTSGPSSWGSKNTALSVKDAGTYYVWAKCDANTGYYNAVSAKYIGTVNVSQRTVTVTAPTIKTDTIRYTGSSQLLLSANGSCTKGGTMYYYVSTSATAPTSFSTTTWSTSAPSQTNVGTYNIWYYAYVSDTKNNTGININTIKSLGSKEIKQRTGAAPTFNADSVTATCIQSGGAVNTGAFDAATAGHSGSITYSITGVVKDGTTTQLTGWSMTTTTSRIITVPASTKPGTYKVTVRATEAQTTTDTSSYKDAVITVILSKGSQTLNLTSSPTNASTTYPTGGTITASGHAGTISASSATTSVATISTSGSKVTVSAIGYGTSDITVTAAQTAYVNAVSKTVTWSVSRRTGAAPTFNADSVTATCIQSGGAVNTGAFDAATAGHSGSITYSITGVVKDGTTTQLTGWSMTTTTSRIITVPASTKPGTYKVTVRATEAQTTTDTSSYKDAVITVILSKGSQTLTLDKTTLSLTVPNTGTIKATGYAGTLSVSSDKTSVATATNSATSTITAVGVGNTTSTTGSATITFTAAATDYVKAVSQTATVTVTRRTGATPTFSASSVTATCSQDQTAKTTSTFTAGTAKHSGTLSYSLVSAKNSSGTSLTGWSVNSSNRTIGIPKNTIAGTYTVVAKCTESQTSSDTSSSTNATITVTLGKGSQTLNLDKTELKLTVPNTGTITASGYAGTLTVTSGTTSVATATNSATSTITAKTAGTSTITFTAAATDYVDSATKTATVTVNRRTGATPTFNTSTVTATCSQDQSAKTTSAFTAATANHGGNLSYSLVSAANSSGTSLTGWSVNSSNRTIGIPKDTISGTYTVVVRATEAQTSTDTSSYKDATITVILEKGSQTLTLDKTTLSLTVPNTGTIKATGYAGTLSVSSDKTSVATATNSATSTITAVGVGNTTSTTGSATITFTAAATDYVKAVSQTATVTVTRRTGATPTFSASSVTATCSQDQTAKTTSTFTAGTAKHSGTLSYSLVSAKNSSGTSLTGWSVNSSNRTIGIPKNTIAGTYTVVAKCTESQTSSDTSSSTNATITVTLSKGSQSLTLTGNPTNFISTYNSGGTITASNHVGTISASSSNNNVATVSVSGSNVTVTCKSAGDSTITVTAAANDYVNAVSKTQVWTINKANATLPTTWAGDSVEYHNKAELTAKGHVGGTLKYRYDADNGTSWIETTTPPTRTTIGTTAVQCMVVGDSNHNDSAWSTTVTLDVYKSDDARMTVTLPDSLTYNTSNQTIASASGIEGVGTYYLGYRKGSEATADSQVTWGSANTTPLQVKDAGTYYVYYKFSPDANHENSKAYTKVGTITIEKKSRSGAVSCNDTTYPNTVTATVSGNTESGKVTWGITNGTGKATIDSTGKVTPTQAGTVTITASVAATSNYAAYTATSKTITISKATGSITYSTVESVSEYCTSTAAAMSQTDTNKSVTVATSSASSSTNTGGTISYSIDKSGWSISDDGKTVTVPSGTVAGTYNVKITASVTTTTNYNAASKQNTVSIVITETVLTNLSMTLTANSVAYGSSTTVASVTAEYNNGKTKSVLDNATYSSNPTGIVTIS